MTRRQPSSGAPAKGPRRFLNELLERRLARFVVGYAAGAWLILQFVDQLADRQIVPELAYRLALVVALFGFPGAIIVTWFHGAKGEQRVPLVEKLLLGALLVVTLGASAWVVRSESAAAPRAADVLDETQDPRRIAVLYFEDRSAGGAEDFLASGLTESLIDELSGIDALHVISRNGVALFRDQAVPSDSVGRALRVGTLVEGTVIPSESRIRVNVALVRAASGDQFASTRVERPRAELFELQDELAREVALFLREEIGAEFDLVTRQAGTNDVQAWELVQRASEIGDEADVLLDQGSIEGASARLIRADSVLAEAEAFDPDWIEPRTERGWLAYRQSRLAGFERDEYDRWIAVGLGHARRALADAPNDPDALELRGTLVYWRYLLNLASSAEEASQLYDQAERDLRASVAAAPHQAGAWNSLSHLLLNRGDQGEGKLAALRSYEADPFLRNANLTVWRLFGASIDLEDQVEARNWCNEGARRFPEDPRFQECQIRVAAMSGEAEVDSIWGAHRAMVERSPAQLTDFNDRKGRMYVAMFLARAGLADSARAVAEGARASTELDPVRELAYYEAIVRTWVGDYDEAVRQIGIYLAANPSQREVLAGGTSWWLRDLEDYPRFRSLVGG